MQTLQTGNFEGNRLSKGTLMDEDLSRMIHPDSLPDGDSSIFIFREKRGKGSAEVVVNEATTENSSFENSKEEAWEGRR